LKTLNNPGNRLRARLFAVLLRIAESPSTPLLEILKAKEQLMELERADTKAEEIKQQTKLEEQRGIRAARMAKAQAEITKRVLGVAKPKAPRDLPKPEGPNALGV
jgi:hypothetical protein